LRIKSLIQYLIIFIIGAVFLYFVFRKIEWQDLTSKLSNATYSWVVLGMLIGLLSHFLRAWRGTLLYKPLGYHVAVSNSFYAVMIGYMMNYIIPRAGELSRCAALQKTNKIPAEKTLGTVITERLVDLAILALILGFVLVLHSNTIYNFLSLQQQSNTQGNKSSMLLILAGIGIVSVAIIWLLRNILSKLPVYQKITKIIIGFTEGLLSIKQVSNPLLFVVLSVGIWVCYILMMYFCLFSLEATSTLSFSNTLVVFAIGTLGIIIPAPAAGAGTYHFAVSQSLLLFGVAESDGIAYATLVHGVQMVVLILVGAVCSIPVLLASKKQKDETR
jgi:uncharacterized protein (TIRG00374 family)